MKTEKQPSLNWNSSIEVDIMSYWQVYKIVGWNNYWPTIYKQALTSIRYLMCLLIKSYLWYFTMQLHIKDISKTFWYWNNLQTTFIMGIIPTWSACYVALFQDYKKTNITFLFLLFLYNAPGEIFLSPGRIPTEFLCTYFYCVPFPLHSIHSSIFSHFLIIY